MTHSAPREFTITFKGVSSAQANQLAEELRSLLRREVGNALEVTRHKEDPNALDEGGVLIILLATTAAISAQHPEAMTDALLTATLVEFAHQHGVELQLEDKLGQIFQIAKNISHTFMEEVKRRLQKFFQKDKDEQ